MKVTCKNCKEDIDMATVPNFSQKVICPNCGKQYQYPDTFKMIYKVIQYVLVVMGLAGFCYGVNYVKNILGYAGTDIKTIAIYIAALIVFFIVFTAIMGIVHKIMIIIFGLKK